MGGIIPRKFPVGSHREQRAVSLGGIQQQEKLIEKVDPEPVPPKPPPPRPPLALPQESGAGDRKRRKIRRHGGRKQTFLTGELIPQTSKSSTLG